MAFDKSKQASGALFVNNKKTSPKAPDYTGVLDITPEFLDVIKANMNGPEGAKMQLSGWRKTSSAGKDFLSLSVQPPFKRDGAPRPPSSRDRDDIPF
jgi:hypothetical protein